MAEFNWRAYAMQQARQHGIRPELFLALIRAESGGRQNAQSGAGAIGFTQLMPGTAQGLGVDPHDPRQNIRGGAMYLAQQLRAFNGDERLALAAYNAGPGNVSKYGGIPPFKETQTYVQRVLGYAGEGSSSGEAQDAHAGHDHGHGGEVERPGATSDAFAAKMNAIFEDDPEFAQFATDLHRRSQPIATPSSGGGGGGGGGRSSAGSYNWRMGKEKGSYRDLAEWGKTYGAVSTSAVRNQPGSHHDQSAQRAQDFGDGPNSDETLAQMIAYAQANPGDFTEFYFPSRFGDWHIENGQIVQGVFPDHEDHIHAARSGRRQTSGPGGSMF